MTLVKFDKKLFVSKLQNEVEKEFKAKLNNLLLDLELATPVDTGLARDSWEITYLGKDKAILSNKQDYIIQLNNGSSKQAPRNFIETTIFNNGLKLSKNIT